MKLRFFGCLGAVLASVVLLGQEPPPAGAGAGAGAGNSTTPPGGNSGGIPGGNQGGGLGGQRPGQQQGGDIFNQQNRFPDRQMPVFLSGKVMLEDGTPPPEPATIERLCNGGTPRPEGYTDSKGRFSIQLGNNMGMMPDASVSSAGDISDITGRSSGSSGMMNPGNQRGISERDLMGCEIRASLPGFRSQVVQLSGRRFLDNPDVGTIILKRLGHVEGTVTSITTLEAPKDAKKAYEKAINLLRTKKDKMPEAQKELERAVELYPRYAVAWFELGAIQERSKNDAEARKSYEMALKADAKFVKPYLQIAGIAAREQNWREVVDATDRVLKLDPFSYPGAYFYSAVGNLNLQNFDAAEKSAREGVKQDELHRIPKLEHVLGVVLAQKNDYTGAAEHMKTYLKLMPSAQDADFVRKQLTEVEKMTTEASAAPVGGNPKP